MKQAITAPEQLSLIIQSARKARGLTQSDVARAFDLSQASLSRLELNAHNMKVTQLLALCKRLGLDLIIQDRATTLPGVQLSAGDKADW